VKKIQSLWRTFSTTRDGLKHGKKEQEQVEASLSSATASNPKILSICSAPYNERNPKKRKEKKRKEKKSGLLFRGIQLQRRR